MADCVDAENSVTSRGSAACGRVLTERSVRAVRGVVLEVLVQYRRAVAWSGAEDVVEAFAAEGARSSAQRSRSGQLVNRAGSMAGTRRREADRPTATSSGRRPG